MDLIQCNQCGLELTGRQRKFCSEACRRRSQAEAGRRHDKVCPECGKNYNAARPEQRFCSRSCTASYGNKQYRGENAKNWKGGRSVRKDGYVRVYAPDSPQAHKDGYAYEHRDVADRKFPFTLPSKFAVHHLNGDKSDNRPENLKVNGSNGRHMREYHSWGGSRLEEV